MFSSQKVPEIARSAEAETTARTTKKQSRIRTVDLVDTDEENQTLRDESSRSESDFILVSSRT